MNHFFNKLHDYCNQFSSPATELLQALERETHLKTLAPQMMSGHLQGQLLQLISTLKQPEAILEVGTFTGYATLCLAKGLTNTGLLTTIEANDELAPIIRKYLQLAGLQERVTLLLGDGLEIIPGLDGPFDIIFIDAGKQDYGAFYELCLPKLRSGGLLLADNVLWSGKVVSAEKDADTLAIHTFNQKIRDDERVKQLMLPLRDGLLIVEKL